MNSIREIQKLNKREIEEGISTEGSWHADYRDTAYIYIGGLPFELTEGDVIAIFSQYGEPVHLNLVRDKETGKSRGFAFLKYEDQRSTDLAVDNLGGATIMGRMLKIDHTRYKPKDGEETDNLLSALNGGDRDGDDRRVGGSDSEKEDRPKLKEEVELLKLMQDHDDDDPMRAYLIQEKQEEVNAALKKAKRERGKHGDSKRKHRHRHRDEKPRHDSGDDKHRDSHPSSRKSRRSESLERLTIKEEATHEDHERTSRRRQTSREYRPSRKRSLSAEPRHGSRGDQGRATSDDRGHDRERRHRKYDGRED